MRIKKLSINYTPKKDVMMINMMTIPRQIITFLLW